MLAANHCSSPRHAKPVLLALALALLLLAPPRLALAEGAVADSAAAAAEPQDGFTLRPSAMMGVTQWVLFGGGNVAAQVKFGRWVAEFSHGQSLHFEKFGGLALTEAERDAGLAVGMPWTTGGGFGFQITPQFHVLIEAKAHRYSVEDSFGGELGYTSFTVGPGLFYDLYVYDNLFVQPNLRWWPTVASTYDGNERLEAADGSEVRHTRHDLLPFANVNIGWTFAGR